MIQLDSTNTCLCDGDHDLGPTTLGTFTDVIRGIRHAVRMPPVTFLELILTENCNLRCSYCWERDKRPHDMSATVAHAAVDFLLTHSRDVQDVGILFFGGEPLLKFDLMKDVWEYVTRRAEPLGKKISWSMTTNGTLLTEDIAQWLAEHGVKYLLSLDGAKEDHDRHRRFPDGRGSFDCIAAKLPFMRRYQPWLGARITVTPETARSLRSSVELLHGLGINQFLFSEACGIPWTSADLAAYETSLFALSDLYLEKRLARCPFRMTLFEECEPGRGPKTHYWGCGAGHGRICADSYGDLYGCSKLANITGNRNGVLPLGNVFQGIIGIDHRKMLNVASVGPRTKCRECQLQGTCSGGCPAVNAAATGSIFLPDATSCQMQAMERRVLDYLKSRWQNGAQM